MPWNLLLLPLLAGFVTLDWCLYTRLRAQRIEGNRLLLEGSFAGILLMVGVYTVFWLLSLTPYYSAIERLWFTVAPRNVAYLGTAFGTFFVGPAGALAVNWFVKRKRDRLYAVKRYAIESAGEYLLGLLHEAAYHGYLVEITTTERKAYLAMIAIAPDLKPESFVVLEPVRIGFKDKDTLQIAYIEEFGVEAVNRPRVVVALKNIETVQVH